MSVSTGAWTQVELVRLHQCSGVSLEAAHLPHNRGVTVSPDEARTIALSMPEAVEQDHHGRPSFRIGGKIFATLWGEDRMNVMLDEGGIRTAVESAPDRCEQVWWGKRLAAVGVTLSRVDERFLRDLLSDAWEQKAPQRLLTG